MQPPDPFAYIAPNEITKPKHAAITAAEGAAVQTLAAVLMIDPIKGVAAWQEDHAGHSDAKAAYADITRVCLDLYNAIREHAPESGDRDAAERYVRLARMCANRHVAENLPNGSILSRMALENIAAAGMMARAAVALGGA